MGIRVIKTAAAATAAIYAALLLQLDYPLSAGLLAILGVDVTRKRSLISALRRFMASVIGLLVGCVLFAAIGFYVWVIALFILIAYPVLSRVNLRDGIVTCSVIVFHVYTAGAVSAAILLNEALLLLVGFGAATVINLLYMPGADKKLEALKRRTEERLSALFLHMADHLEDVDRVWDGIEIVEVHALLDEAEELARKNRENRLFGSEDPWAGYFRMRQEQLESIQHMMALLAQVYRTIPSGQRVARLFVQLSEDVKGEFYTGHVEDLLDELQKQFAGMPLPQTREEFEIRSAVLQLCVELRRYLLIAKKNKKPKPD